MTQWDGFDSFDICASLPLLRRMCGWAIRAPRPILLPAATEIQASRFAFRFIAFLSHNSATCLVNAASSTGRCNTIQCIDSRMLARENHLFGCTRSKPSQGSVPAGLTLASDFGFCFQCQAGSSLVLRRPIETTQLTRHVELLSR